MRLKSLSIKNFRCYQKEISISFDSLTTFVGKNDIGKSSILEALEIFFNNDTARIEQGDANIYSGESFVSIICEFSDLPTNITLDAGATTSLADEYLLTESGTLKVKKIYDCSKRTPSVEIFILSHHPTAEGVANLLELKEKDLQLLVKQRSLTVSLKGNPGMRKAIWTSVPDLQLEETEIPVSKPKEDSKQIWEQLESNFPLFALFQSDRSSKDSDGEVQDPMKVAVASAIAEVQEEIERIQQKVQQKAEEIARNTHSALKEIDGNLAKNLNPLFNPPSIAKWTGLFSISMDTDDGIPLNKRGSGIRRLVLVSFFKAEAERRLKIGKRRSIIYAIEEPETAQHPNNQKILIESFKTLSSEADCQMMLTTHSPGFASELPVDGIRFITRDDSGNPTIEDGLDVFGKVADALGLVPDSRVKILLCVEGPTDVYALKCLSQALHKADNSIIDLTTDSRVAFIVLGGGTLKHWVTEHYLKALLCPEVHIYDNDVADYARYVNEVNQRADGRGSWAVQTTKYEIESYLHKSAIQEAFGFAMDVIDYPGADGKAVPKIFAEAFAASRGYSAPLKDSNAKAKLAEQAFPKMTSDMIRERDPNGEVEGWFRRIGNML